MQEGKRRTPEEMREDYRRSYTNLKAAIADSVDCLERLLEEYKKGRRIQEMLEQESNHKSS